MAARFGTSGLRGLATDLTGGPAYRHVVAFTHRMISAGYIKQGANVYIAQDRRESSPVLAQETAMALSDCGMIPIDCGVIPTPALALYAMNGNAAAIMITGSHIPADRNGIKFYRPDGEIDKMDEAAIVAGAIHAKEMPSKTSIKMADESQAALAGYFDRYADVLPKTAFANQKIGIYQHSSVARDFLMRLITHFGGEAIALENSETFIPIDTEAVEIATLDRMALIAKAQGLAAIISTDADADRPLVLDENGAQIRGDVLGIITASALKADFICVPVTSNSSIEKSTGASVALTNVGSPFVIAAMEKGLAAGFQCVTGFEPNGGFLLASPANLNGTILPELMTRDSALPILMALDAGAKAGSLSSFVASMKLPVVVGDRLQNYPTAKGAGLIKLLIDSETERAKFVAEFGKIQSINTIDGLRMLLDTGVILHLRPSGNAPEMRCYVEAQTATAANAILEKALQQIAAFS